MAFPTALRKKLISNCRNGVGWLITRHADTTVSSGSSVSLLSGTSNAASSVAMMSVMTTNQVIPDNVGPSSAEFSRASNTANINATSDPTKPNATLVPAIRLRVL